MPFLQNEDEELKQQNAGQISGPSAGPMSSAAPQKAPQQKSSGSWTNLQTYMNANKDNAAQMGQTVAKSADDAGQEAAKQVQEFQTKTPQAVKTYSADELKTNFYDNPNADKQAYKTIESGYTGPSSLEDMGYSGVESSVKKANEAVSGIQTEEGRQKTLGEIYKKPSYTAGQKTFDNLLIQNSPEARQAAQDVGQRWSNLTNTFKSATDAASAVIPQNIAAGAANQTTADQAEQDYLNSFYKDLESTAANTTLSNTSAINNLQSHLASGNLTPADLELLGLTGGQRLYNLTPSSYVNYDNTELKAKDVATDEQRQKWSNLLGLMNRTDPRLEGAPVSVNPITTDKGKLATDVAGKESEFNQVAASTQFAPSQVTQLQTSGAAKSATLTDFLNSGLTPEQFESQVVMEPGTAQKIKDILAQYGYNNTVATASPIQMPKGGKLTGSLK